jgi:hypothetical protein
LNEEEKNDIKISMKHYLYWITSTENVNKGREVFADTVTQPATES